MKSFDGYKKQTIGNSEVLLAGGGSKTLSDFLMSSVAADTYLPRNTNSEILPQFNGSPSCLLGIETFADGGTIKWQSTSDIEVGLANMIKNNITVASSSSVDNGIWFNNGTRTVFFGTGESGNTGIYVNSIGWVVDVNPSGSIFLNGTAGYASSAGSIPNPYTAHLQINGRVFGYNYGIQGNNAVAFMWDKPGSHYTGVGANGVQDQIYFGACDGKGNWVASYKQKWRFNGGIYADSLNGCTPAYQTYDNNFILHTNEFNFIPDNYNQVVYFNYQSPSRNSSSIITEYRMHNGRQSYANVSAANFYASSDIKLKTNINSISKILPIVEFDWKENKKHSYGFIAQQIEKEYPELISNGETKTVNYSAALSLYLAKLSNIVEQNDNNTKAKIIEMERRIDKLENKFQGGPSKVIDLFKYRIAI